MLSLCLCFVLIAALFLYYVLRNDIIFFKDGVNLASRQLLQQNDTDHFETKLYLSTTPTIISSHPKFIKHILDSSNYRARFGSATGLRTLGMYQSGLIWNYNLKKWKATRKFFHQSLNNDLFTNSFIDIIQIIQSALKLQHTFIVHRHHNDTPTYDILQLLRTITMNVTKNLFFGSDIDLPPSMCASIIHYFKAWEFFFLYPIYIRRCLNPWKYGVHQQAVAHLMRNCDVIINQCVSIYNNNRNTDSLKPFIKAVIKAYYEKKNAFSYDDMRQTVLEMFLAGTDTSSVSMFYTLFGIKKSSNPSVYTKLQQEILEMENAYASKDSRQFEKSFLPVYTKEWVYLTATLQESMRIKPVGPVIMRRALDDDVYNNKSIIKDTQIILCLEIMHNNPQYFEDPFTFNPQRFMDSNTYYAPFGEGPKGCAGQHLAIYEMKIILYYLLRHFDFESSLELNDIMTNWDIAQQPINIYEMTMINKQ